MIISVGEIEKKGFSKVTIYYEWKKYYRQISKYQGTPNVSNLLNISIVDPPTGRGKDNNFSPNVFSR